MRLLQAALSIVFCGAMVLWLYAAAHGFHGTYCFHSSGSLTCGTNVTFHGPIVLWSSPAIAIVCVVLLREIKKRGLRQMRR